jgi:TldD protein
MIKAVKKGYILEGYFSGMEDPKNWGIQCVIAKAREIIDGKFSGVIVSPVILTGYVPTLLKSISMVANNPVKLSGTGYCGKGHKEFVKTSTGGTYILAKGRLS